MWPEIASRAFDGSHGLPVSASRPNTSLPPGVGVSGRGGRPRSSGRAGSTSCRCARAAGGRGARAAPAVVASARGGEQPEREQRGAERAAQRDAADEHASISSLPPVAA